MLLRLLKNPVIGYISSRYLTYAIQFVNSLFIAVYLGPIYLGIWGFISLVLQYLAQINLGIPHSLSIIISISKYRKRYVSKVVGNALFLTFLLSFLIALFFFIIQILDFKIGVKYGFDQYIIYVLIITIAGYFNSILSNVLRIYGRIWEIAFGQSVFPLCVTVLLFIFRGQALLEAIVIANMVSVLFTSVLFFVRFPISVDFNASPKLAGKIQRRGIFLFLYNTSFYFIIISTRSFVSEFFEVSQFGFFTFAFSLANILMLVIDAFTYLIWPKLINKLSHLKNQQSFILLHRVREVYIFSTHFLAHLGVFLFPYFILLFPQYENTYMAFALISLSIVLYTNSFGYQGLLMARGKERKLGFLVFLILLFNIVACYVAITVFDVDFDKVILATLLSYSVYTFILGIYGRKLLNYSTSFFNVLNDLFPWRIMLPFIFSIFLLFSGISYQWMFLPFLLYTILNKHTIATLYSIIKRIMNDSQFLEF